jgi:DNA-directed RNA polymerase I subunit RPA1
MDSASVQERVGRGKGHATAKMYTVKLNFFPSEEYCKTYAITVTDVMNTIERKFVPNLCLLIKKELRKRKNEAMTAADKIGVKSGVVEIAAPAAQAQRDEDDDEDDENGDGDATSAKLRANRGEEVSYGPNDDEDDALQKTLDTTGDMAEDSEDEDDGGASASNRPRRQAEDSYDDDSGSSDGEDEVTLSAQARTERVLNKNLDVCGFTCDEKDGSWCSIKLEYPGSTPKLLMLNLVQDAVKKSVIQQISGVGTCTFVDERDGPVIHTEGVNLRAMQKYSDFIDPHRISTNDIGAVLDVYGVEAGRATIVAELGGVFDSHGIKVDNRHLNLIADYMTRNGGFTPFNRNGLKGNVSPFTKMSFETTLAFLKDAVLDGDWDDLTTPSSRLVMGRLGKVGTGGFDVLTQLPTHYDETIA